MFSESFSSYLVVESVKHTGTCLSAFSWLSASSVQSFLASFRDRLSNFGTKFLVYNFQPNPIDAVLTFQKF